MANSVLSSLSSAAPPATGGSTASPGRHRLRAVDRDETAPAPVAAPAPAGFVPGRIVDFLPPDATWLPAPQHTLPSLPGQPPMVGYLVLVPAERHAAALAASAPRTPAGGAGPVLIDGVQRIAVVDGAQLDLTYLEFELLAHLVAHPNRVHTRDQLVTTVWGYGHVGDGRTVDVHVARLRRKLGAEHRRTIQTVRRVGYKYTP
ncbi:winged helix-turn-helix domain-containing protein [Streptomyces corynorhini]|uniref:Winged helix family transcriptional regulator n=1 Tax=Streptomyces corynorhini TaxID=2282652 RepID=A0A370AU20_9ACTN|nr:winged helix-turn-helix domain-containing protein [Streptomyces corynorhini]RDG32841.1 winged helix family transcriptional regulator [Streptomyces corynorhini]